MQSKLDKYKAWAGFALTIIPVLRVGLAPFPVFHPILDGLTNAINVFMDPSLLIGILGAGGVALASTSQPVIEDKELTPFP